MFRGDRIGRSNEAYKPLKSWDDQQQLGCAALCLQGSSSMKREGDRTEALTYQLLCGNDLHLEQLPPI